MSQKYTAGYVYKARIICLLLLIFHPICTSLSVDNIKDMFQDKSCIEGVLVNSPRGPTIVTTTGAQQQTHTNFLPSLTEGIQDFANMLPKLYSGMNYFQNTPSTLSNSPYQSPMSLINELAQYNNIEYRYYLIKEDGSEHQKHFTIALKLGNEEYVADGSSIRRAERAAATKALTHSNYDLQSIKTRSNQAVTPDMKLQTLALQLGEKLFNKEDKINNMYSSQVNNKQQALYDEFDRNDNLDTRHMYKYEHNQMNDHNSPPHECQLGNEYARMIDRNLAKSPVAVVYEIGAKKKINVAFELINENGPGHAKVFGTRCSFGHLVADSVGNSKKKSKNEAAKKMLLLLRMLPDTCMDDSLQQKTRKRKNRKKKKKNARREKLTGENASFNGLNIGSSLNQIQQTFKKMDSMLSSLGQSSISNVGSLKKLAKRSASEFIGNENYPQSIKPSTEHKSDNNELTQLKSLQDKMAKPRAQDTIDNPFKPDMLRGMRGLPDQLNDQLKQNMDSYQRIAKNFLDSDIAEAANSLMRNINTDNLQQPQIPESSTRTSFKEELVYMMDLLDLKVEFSDFPTANNTKYMSIVSVPTNPGRACIGEGLNIEISQEKAAAEALFDLSEQGLDNIISRKH